jgi:putative molybdopterin biosynthesis protein
VLSRDVVASIDVPAFDRSNFDGFAVRASDTYGAREESPRRLQLLDEVISPGVPPRSEVSVGVAAPISTGAVVPRGADAIVMVELADIDQSMLWVRHAVVPGFGITFAGTDISQGETVLRRGEVLTSRETGVLAAVGVDHVHVWRRPCVAIISTGNELAPPGSPPRPGGVYDSNARILADAVIELGGEPVVMGIVRDDLDQLRSIFAEARQIADVIVLSGGTSKGAGDLSYRIVSELSDPGIVAHGVALKPGKPICLAASQRKPIAVLPGFPTSAVFTFHEFVAPVIRRLAGRPPEDRDTVPATMAVKVNSEIGRTEYLLVGLVERPKSATPTIRYAAYPMGKGSGSVTNFGRADGFVTIDRHTEIVEPNQVVTVTLLSRRVHIADLVVMGSHCIGLDYLLGRLHDQGFHTKFLSVGSTAGLEAAKRGECDLAGIHLLDADSGAYNRPFLTPDLKLISGYRRRQGIVFRPDDARFVDHHLDEVMRRVLSDTTCLMVNRNQGSGTRILIDRILKGACPNGYAVQARHHGAVANAIVQGRADWGVAIAIVAEQYGLGFLPLQDEQFDFLVPKARADRPAVLAFQRLLSQDDIVSQLKAWGFEVER